jgi:hypothetical protein
MLGSASEFKVMGQGTIYKSKLVRDSLVVSWSYCAKGFEYHDVAHLLRDVSFLLIEGNRPD